MAQQEHRQIYPRPGWVEHDAEEIWTNVEAVIAGALAKAGVSAADVAAVGITNQRETTLVWEKASGKPIANAIVWQDTRTDRLVAELGGAGQDRFRAACGLPLATYFSGPKLRWLLDATPGAREKAERGELLFGTMDTWVIWKLTGRHVTDVTNASRTMLMNLATLDWDDDLLAAIGVPRAMLPGSGRRPRSMGPRAGRWRVFPSPPRSVTSRRPSSARPASRPARASAPTAPAASCWSTPASGRSSRRTASSPPSASSWPGSRRSTRWRARSR